MHYGGMGEDSAVSNKSKRTGSGKFGRVFKFLNHVRTYPIVGKNLKELCKTRFHDDHPGSCVKNKLIAGKTFKSCYESRSKAIRTRI